MMSASVTIIDGVTEQVLATLPVGTTPLGMAVNTVTNKIYVACGGVGRVYVISGASDSVPTNIAVGTNPLGLAVNPATSHI